MRLVKQRPKYHCDFCSRTSTKEAMEIHERICWKNPNRYCETCKGTGKVYEDDGGYAYGRMVDCWYCKEFDPVKADPLGELEKAAKNP